MEQFPRSSSRSSRHASDQQAPHERSRANRQATEPRHAAGSHRAPANKGAHTNSAAKEQAPTRPKSRYIPALDGLRTLAVVAVVLYHLNLTWAQGGLLGVTIFFVLSGYLITRLLINEVSKTGRIDLKSFWIRRIRRLFPAVVTVVVVTCALCTIFNHVMLTKMRPDILPSLLFFNNWWQIAQNVSYFNALGDPSPLTHFWSLAIEEQFYLIWPPLLFAMVSMHVSKPNTRRVVLGLAAVSALAMMVLYNPAADPSRVYYGTDTRVFSLLLGAWMAFIPIATWRRCVSLIVWGSIARWRRQARQERRGQTWREGRRSSRDRPGTAERPRAFWSSPASIDVLGVVGLVGLAAMVALTNGYTAFQYRGGTLLCSILTLMVIAACVQPQGMVARALSAEPLVWVGKRSYSIYLWHYPLLLLMNPVANINDTPWWQYILQVLLVVAVAECCYRFIETRLGRAPWAHRRRIPRWHHHARQLGTHAHPCLRSLRCRVGRCTGRPDLCARDVCAERRGRRSSEQGSQEHRAHRPAGGRRHRQGQRRLPRWLLRPHTIGDSVSLRAVDSFDGVFPHSHIDAEKGRQFDAGRATFEGYLQQNLAGKVVVFALGTNGLVTDDQIDAIMADAGDKRIVAFVNTRSPQPWVGSTNQAIANAATRYKNVRVIDWYGYSANRNDLFDGDGTHLSTTGVTEYLNSIHDASRRTCPYTRGSRQRSAAGSRQVCHRRTRQCARLKPHKLGTDK
ncbi:MAG: acyltransferase family protein [Collinsella sp.]